MAAYDKSEIFLFYKYYRKNYTQFGWNQKCRTIKSCSSLKNAILIMMIEDSKNYTRVLSIQSVATQNFKKSEAHKKRTVSP